jgi:hypothetical protein
VVARLDVIFGSHSLNFVRNTGYVEIIMKHLVANVPGCIYYSACGIRRRWWGFAMGGFSSVIIILLRNIVTFSPSYRTKVMVSKLFVSYCVSF